MKKWKVYISICIVLLLFCGCGATDDARGNIVDGTEKTEDNNVESEDSGKDLADTEGVVDNITDEDSDEVYADILTNYLLNLSANEGNYATNYYQLGDSVEFLTGNDGKFEVTLTEWGSYYDSLTDTTLLYVQYEIVNTGTVTLSLGNGWFDIYADNYAVSQELLLPDVVVNEDISPGRNLRGKLYGEVNPFLVQKIEVEIGDATFLINDKSGVTYPILLQGYVDGFPCPVMVNDEANDELRSGTVEDMLYSCINDRVTMYASPNMYGGDIYLPTRWDAPDEEWYSGLLTYEQFIGIVNWMDVVYAESGIGNIYTFISRENVEPLAGEWINDNYEISISISSDWSYGYSYDLIGSCEIDGKEGQVLLIGSSDDSVFVFCVTSSKSWAVIGCANDGSVYIRDFSRV